MKWHGGWVGARAVSEPQKGLSSNTQSLPAVISLKSQLLCPQNGDSNAPSDTVKRFLRYGYYSLEKEIATHSSNLAGIIPWTVELDGLQSMGLQRIRHD